MANNDSRIQVKLLADANAYEQVMAKAISTNKRYGDSASKEIIASNQEISESFGLTSEAVTSIKNNLAGLSGVIAGAFAIETIRSFVGETMAALDQTQKFADRIGMATDSLQGLRYAAGQSGVEVGQFDTAMQRMTRRVAEAANGTGEAKGALEELGLSAKKLAQLKPEHQLKFIADAMNDVAEHGDKVRLSMKLFDSEGVGLINLLAAGSEGIQEMEDRAKTLGAVIERDLIDNVASANDAIDDMNIAIGATSSHFAAELAPALQVSARAIADNVDLITSAIGVTFYAAVGRATAGIINFSYEQVKSISSSRAAAAATIAQAKQEERLALAQKAAALTSIQSRAADQRLTAARATLASVTTKATIATTAFKSVMSFIGGPAGVIMLAASAITYFATKTTDAKESTDDLTKSLKDLTMNQLYAMEVQMRKAIRNTKGEIDNLTKEIKDTKTTVTISSYATGGKPVEVVSRNSVENVAEMNGRLDTLNQKLETQKNRVTEIKDAMKGIYKKDDDNTPTLFSQEESDKALASLTTSLATQEELIKQSYEKRKAEIEKIQASGHVQQAALIDKLNKRNEEQYDQQLEKLKDQEKKKVQAAMDRDANILLSYQQRLMNEEELLNSKEQQDLERAAREIENETMKKAALLAIEKDYQQQRQELKDQKLIEEEEKNKSYWDKLADHIRSTTDDFDAMWGRTFDRFTAGFGDAVADAVVDGENFGDVMGQVANGLAKSMISALVEIGAQRLVLWTLEKTLGASANAGYVAQVSGQAIAGQQLAAINAFASTAAIPVIGPGLAPGAAAAAEMATAPMVAAATTAATSTFAGAFDVGGTIPAGKFGIVGEAGLELVEGPARVTSRAKTERLFENANGSASNQPQWIINVNEAPPGTTATIDEANQIITIAVKKSEENTINQIRKGGPITKAGQQHLNWQRNPSR